MSFEIEKQQKNKASKLMRKYRRKKISREDIIRKLKENMFNNDYIVREEFLELITTLDIKSEELFDFFIVKLNSDPKYDSIVKKIRDDPITKIRDIICDFVIEETDYDLVTTALICLITIFYYDGEWEDRLEKSKKWQITAILDCIQGIWISCFMWRNDYIPDLCYEFDHYIKPEIIAKQTIDELLPLFIRIMRFTKYPLWMTYAMLRIKAFIAEVLSLKGIHLEDIMQRYVSFYEEEKGSGHHHFNWEHRKDCGEYNDDCWDSFYMRQNALTIITETSKEKAIPVLLSAVTDPCYSLHQFAMKELVDLHVKEVIPVVKQYYYYGGEGHDFYEDFFKKMVEPQEDFEKIADYVVYNIDYLELEPKLEELAKKQPIEVFDYVVSECASHRKISDFDLNDIAKNFSYIELNKDSDELKIVIEKYKGAKKSIASRIFGFMS